MLSASGASPSGDARTYFCAAPTREKLDFLSSIGRKGLAVSTAFAGAGAMGNVRQFDFPKGAAETLGILVTDPGQHQLGATGGKDGIQEAFLPDLREGLQSQNKPSVISAGLGHAFSDSAGNKVMSLVYGRQF